MAYACEYCGKTINIGHNVSHAKNRLRKLRKPNLHSKRVLEATGMVRRLLCVKCARNAIRPQDLRVEAATPKTK